MTRATPSAAPKLSDLGLDLLRVSRAQVVWSVVLPLLAFAAYWPLASQGYWIAAVGCLVVLSFKTYGSTSHDLVHRNLGLQPLTNEVLLALFEGIALRSGHAYRATHLYHHEHYPSEDDIEAAASRMSFLRALLEGVVFQFRIYGWALRHARRRRVWIVAEGAAVVLAVVVAVAAAGTTEVPLVYVLCMVGGSWIIPLITSYVPHDPSGVDELHQTRLFRGFFWRLVAFDHLYHLEHHLYPAVPHQNWPQLADRLDPWFASSGLRSVRVGLDSHAVPVGDE
ncbi:MAG: fatty acid desaturase [Planctomycetota bacterium]